MLQNPHASSRPVWGTLSHHHCMHCHSNHALQHSQQVLSVCESRGFGATELAGLDMFDSTRAAPPDPKGEAVAVRGDNFPWDCGEHPADRSRQHCQAAVVATSCQAAKEEHGGSAASATCHCACGPARGVHHNPMGCCHLTLPLLHPSGGAVLPGCCRTCPGLQAPP